MALLGTKQPEPRALRPVAVGYRRSWINALPKNFRTLLEERSGSRSSRGRADRVAGLRRGASGVGLSMDDVGVGAHLVHQERGAVAAGGHRPRLLRAGPGAGEGPPTALGRAFTFEWLIRSRGGRMPTFGSPAGERDLGPDGREPEGELAVADLNQLVPIIGQVKGILVPLIVARLEVLRVPGFSDLERQPESRGELGGLGSEEEA